MSEPVVESPGHRPGAVGLREARAADAIAIARAFGAARADMRYLPQLHSAAEDVAYFTEQVLPASRVTVAERGDVIVGFSAVRDGWLDHLYVTPDGQAQGIGRALLDRAMMENPAGLCLWAFAANLRALAFYGRAGFVEVLRTDGSANEEREPDVQMRWSGGALPGAPVAAGAGD